MSSEGGVNTVLEKTEHGAGLRSIAPSSGRQPACLGGQTLPDPRALKREPSGTLTPQKKRGRFGHLEVLSAHVLSMEARS